MILVTGGTGLLGSRVLLDLIRKGNRVRALKRNESDFSVIKRMFTGNETLLKEIEWVEGNVLDVYTLSEAMKDIRHVYHCAAVVSFNPSDHKKMMTINTQGVANIVNAALDAEVERLCHVSSIAALGRAMEGQLISEETEWEVSSENSMYAVSKYLGEQEVWRGVVEGLEAVVVNPSVILGPGNWSNGGSAGLFSQVWNGIRFYSEGVNGFVDVRDVSKTMLILMNSADKSLINQRYVVSSGNFSYKEIFNCIADNLKKNRPDIKVNYWLAELGWRVEAIKARINNTKPLITKETARTARRNYSYANDKIVQATGIDFISIEESIKSVCETFLKEVSV